jgi:DNA modification methylase
LGRFPNTFIVYKLGSGRVPRPEHGPRRQWEMCLYAIKGDKNVTGIFSDVIPCKLEENLSHGANKPVELYVDLLRRSIRPGDSVLDALQGQEQFSLRRISARYMRLVLKFLQNIMGFC